MASERVKKILIKKGAPFTAAQIDAMDDSAGWKWIYTFHPPKTHRDDDKRTQICFTGFTDDEKIQFAAAYGQRFHIVTGVTKSLQFLVAGPNAGPVKLQKAEEQGVTVLTLEQFQTMLTGGEVPQ